MFDLFDPDRPWHWIAFIVILLLLIFVLSMIVWPSL